MTLARTLVGLQLVVCLGLCQTFALAQYERFDVVIAGGRVVDPESGLDAVRNVGIRGGIIATIAEKPLAGNEVVDASGLVVAPGFIDLHSHAQTLAGHRMQAFDGVTTSLELETGMLPTGMLPIGLAYKAAAREGRPLNYGYSSSWSIARSIALAGLKSDGTLRTVWKDTDTVKWARCVEPQESRHVLDLVEEGLREGGIGVGMPVGYAPDSNRDEFFEIAKLARKLGVPVFTHIRYLEPYGPKNSLIGHQELIALAAMTGAHMHICHLNSTASKRIPEMLEAVEGASGRGLKVTFEGYPYGAGSPTIAAPFLAPTSLANTGLKWPEMLGIAADQRAGQGDDLATGSRQSAGRVALCGICAFLFVDLVEHEVLEEATQVTLDVQGWLVPPYLSGHLPQG